MNFFEELQRRNVFRVAIGYAVLAWLLAQVADLFLEAFGAPEWAMKSLLLLLLLGFPLAVFFAWAFELTPEGLKREKEVDRSQSITRQTGRKLDRAIIAVLVMGLGYFAWDKFGTGSLSDQAPATSTSSTGTEPVAAEVESAGGDELSIAVLPFENRSQREEDAHFSSGIHDDLLTQLAQVGSLRVISRTSVAQFENTTLSIREIAETLGVATILEGGVQRSGNHVRINMQLIDAETDGHLWAQTYDRELTANNVFAIQSEIAGAVTNALRITLTPDEQKRISEVPTENMAALEHYFKGRAEMDERTLPALNSARLRFEEARKLDPGFALAWAGEAQTILLLSDGTTSYGDIPRLEAIEMARRLLEGAYDLAPDDPQVLGVYGLLENSAFRYKEALEYFRRSLLANPSSGEVLNWQRMAQAGSGLRQQALATAARMIEVDPLSKIALANAIPSFINTPHDDGVQVERLLDRLESLDKSFGLSARGDAAVRRGHIVEGVRHFYAAIEADPGRNIARRDLSVLLMDLGLVDEAMHVNPELDAFDEAMGRGNFQLALQLTRADLEREIDMLRTQFRMLYLLVRAEDAPEEAMPFLENILLDVPNAETVLRGWFLDFAWIASLAEYPAEAARYRAIGAQDLQKRLEMGESGAFIENDRAKLAMLDGRHADALQAMDRAIALGERYPFMETWMFHVPLKDQREFQALVSHMRDIIASERAQVVALLCGPDRIVSSHEPAPETCQGQTTT